MPILRLSSLVTRHNIPAKESFSRLNGKAYFLKDFVFHFRKLFFALLFLIKNIISIDLKRLFVTNNNSSIDLKLPFLIKKIQFY